MEEKEQNRSEEATPYKLEEARKRGSVAKSQEINSFGILIWMGIAVTLLGKGVIQRITDIASQILSQAATMKFDDGSIVNRLAEILLTMGQILLPFLVGTMTIGIAVNLIQTGPMFSFFPLKPDLERINPIAGFKRLISSRILVETIKTILKLTLLGVILYYFLQHLIPSTPRLLQTGVSSYIAFMLTQANHLILKLSCALALVVAIDVIYTKWEFRDRMRMSKREVKDEIKRREGDPRIRQKIRELQREAAKRHRALQEVKNADVLITNPTHIAIALQYRKDSMDAPRIVAKGAGEMAAQMRLLASRYRVPIVENKTLARSLFREARINQAVRDEHFPIVAKILVWAYAQRKASQPHREVTV